MQQHAFTRAFDNPRNSIDNKLLGPKHFPWRDLVGNNNIGHFSKANPSTYVLNSSNKYPSIPTSKN